MRSGHDSTERRWRGIEPLFVALAFFAGGCVNTDNVPTSPNEERPDTGIEEIDLGRDLSALEVDFLDDQDAFEIDEASELACEPERRVCLSETIALVCDREGASQSELKCEPTQRCAQGRCVDEPICAQGESFCLDNVTRQFCRPGGLSYGTQSCEAESACVQGECASGAQDETRCERHEECASGLCHCGAQTEEGCSSDGFATPGYCTSRCDTGQECARSQRCLSSQVHLLTSQEANYDHCVSRCEGACEADEQACIGVPVRDDSGAAGWAEGCYFEDVKALGEVCESDVECVGGRCLKGYLSQGDGYCSTPCEQGGCPQGAACVELLEDSWWCTLLCGDGVSPQAPCPLRQTDNRLDVTCAVRQKREGGSARVCVSTSG